MNYDQLVLIQESSLTRLIFMSNDMAYCPDKYRTQIMYLISTIIAHTLPSTQKQCTMKTSSLNSPIDSIKTQFPTLHGTL